MKGIYCRFSDSDMSYSQNSFYIDCLNGCVSLVLKLINNELGKCLALSGKAQERTHHKNVIDWPC